MKILVLGGGGYIGTRLSNHLSSKGHEISVLDHFWFGDFLSSEITKTKKNISEVTKEDLEGFDSVLFLAGLANDPMAMFRPDLNFIENSATPTYVGYIAKEAKVKRFICASSCSVYGYTKNEILDENSIVKPSYPYGISKLQCETGIQILEDSNFRPILFRKGTVGGWSPKMRFDLVVNTMLKSALTTKKIIVNNPDLWRPLIDIRDVIQGYEKALLSDLKYTGIYNLSGDNFTIGQLGQMITDKLNSLGFSVELIINNIDDLRNYKVSADKIQKDLEYYPNFTPLDSIDEILNEINPNNFDFEKDMFYNINTFKKILNK
jgi:nucleoside-diphosphate-sugar epimerase